MPAAPVLVYIDPERIRQVIDGLCDNTLRVIPVVAPLILAIRPAPTGGVIEVRDGGSGFTDSDLAVAFEPDALYQHYRGIRHINLPRTSSKPHTTHVDKGTRGRPS